MQILNCWLGEQVIRIDIELDMLIRPVLQTREHKGMNYCLMG